MSPDDAGQASRLRDEVGQASRLPSRRRSRPGGASRRGGRWSFRSTWGEVAFAGLWLAVASGVAIAVPYDVQQPYDSVALVLLTNPAAAFFRSVHYWSGQVFLVLTLVHAWDHLARWTESNVPRAMWWRVTASLPLAVFVMLSGFMLKGDGEAQQAIRIVTTLVEQVPWVGGLISVALFGTEANRQVLYVHHVASASLLVWLFVAEHARATWPRLATIVTAMAPVAFVSLLVSPALHDGLDPVVKGPWYFLGLQEVLHWTDRPAVVLAVAAAIVVLLAAMPRLSDRLARAGKRALVAGLAGYAVLTVIGFGFRGANWAWSPPALLGGEGAGPGGSGLVFHGLSPWFSPPAEPGRPIPVVVGRREGCLHCHDRTTGLSPSHSGEAVGCASCHAGNPFSLHRATAHAGVVRIPGNLASARRTCGTAACHPSQVERVTGSLMASMAGIVAVDRAVFGEARGGDIPHVTALGRSGADGHLRQLCASCHLGGEKTVLGPVGEQSRGGGCSACHLVYSPKAREALATYERERELPGGDRGERAARALVHPDLSIGIERANCFGCHSRSGRISTSYDGWMEVAERGADRAPAAGQAPARVRTLADGRTFEFVAADVHARRMECVDCHTAREVMGDGVAHARAADALRVACTDCHIAPAGSGHAPPAIVSLEQLDAESRRLAALRHRDRPGERFLATAAGAHPLVNTGFDADGSPWLLAKATATRLPMKPPAAGCLRSDGHERLSCISCHAAWAPRCPQCHTSFDAAGTGVDLLDGRTTRGEWIETAGRFSAVPPTLGMRAVAGGAATASAGRTSSARPEVVDTFIPGMVLTLDRSQLPGGPAGTAFRRLYARSFSHTVGKARDCRSCHADPVALGYGEGVLLYEPEGDGGKWRFTPERSPGPDGLPADAWTGFLRERAAAASTRAGARPFNVAEQRRILTVGACLTCHDPTADGLGLQSCAKAGAAGAGGSTPCTPMPRFPDALARASSWCRLPRW